MSINILMLDEKSVDEFWRLRMALFEELGEIKKDTNISELKSVTKQYYLSHINKDLISWGILCDNKLAAIGALCLFYRIPYEENHELTNRLPYELDCFDIGLSSHFF